MLDMLLVGLGTSSLHRRKVNEMAEEVKKFRSEETETWHALFVNSESPPDNYVPLNYYRYSEDFSGKLNFQRLFVLEYIQEKEGFAMRHRTMEWLPVEVKPHCHLSLKQQIDSYAGLKEFLVPN